MATKNVKFSGVQVINDFTEFQKFYADGKVPIAAMGTGDWYPNLYLVLKSEGQQSALARVSSDGKYIVPLKNNREFFDVKPRNKEQALLFDMLSNQDIKVCTITGRAGTGKSLLIGAYISEMLMSKKVTKVVISKPMETVGSGKFLGAMPGDQDSKFDPFLINFKYLFVKLAGPKGGAYFDAHVKKGLIQFLPIEFMRGVSFADDTIVWVDECQNINASVTKTIGTRIGEDSRLILSGDYNQIDSKEKEFKPGIVEIISSEMFKKSPITGHLHLLKVERGPVSQLFSDIFEDE